MTMENQISTDQFSNWMKAGLALNVGKAAIQPLVVNAITSFRDDILKDSPTKYCDQCTYTNVIHCKTKGFCYGPSNNCTTHDSSDPDKLSRPCPNDVCGKLLNAISQSHKLKPIWTNTDAKQWCQDPWTIAKCFMPDGYANASKAETDFTGVLSVIINAKFMKNSLFHPESLTFTQLKDNHFRLTMTHYSEVIKDLGIEMNEFKQVLQEMEGHKYMTEAQQQRHKSIIGRWLEDDKMFVETRALKHVETLLKYPNNCVLVTGPPGSGKSFLTRHIALDLKKYQDFQILPISEPTELLRFHRLDANQVFLMDDIYGDISLNSTLVDNWRMSIGEISSIFNTDMQSSFFNIPNDSFDISKNKLTHGNANTSFRSMLLMTSRLHVYKEVHLNPVWYLMLKQCNITDENLILTIEERFSLVQSYLPKYKHVGLEKNKNSFDFPLLCKFAKGLDSEKSVCNLFLFSTTAMANDINMMKNENKTKFCCLCLCVMFDDSLSEKWLCNTVSCKANIEIKIKSVFNVFDLKYRNENHRQMIKLNLEILENSYLKLEDGIWSFMHKKFYELCAKICGQFLFETYVIYGSSTFLANRYYSQNDEQPSDDTLLIEIPPSCEQTYFNRLQCDLARGDTISSFYNHQLRYASFRERIFKIFEQSTEIKSTLVSKFTDTDYVSNPLYYSAIKGHIDVIKFWIKFNFKTNQNKVSIDQCMFLACASGQTKIVAYLLETGIKVDVQDINGISAFMLACCFGQQQMVEMLLNNDVNVKHCDKHGRTGFMLACEKGHGNIVSLLLENDVDPNVCCKEGRNGFILACRNGHEQIVKVLLLNGVDPNDCCKNGVTGFLYACAKGHDKIVSFLLEKGVDPTVCCMGGLHGFIFACLGGQEQIVSLLMERGVDPNTSCDKGVTGFIYACGLGHAQIVSLLLEKNVEPNVACPNGKTGFMLACVNGHERIVSMLLETSIDPNCCDDEGFTGFMFACYGGYERVVSLLLENNVNVLVSSKAGFTGFILACINGNEKVVAMLLEHDREHCYWNIICGTFYAFAFGHATVLEIVIGIIGFRKFVSAFVNVLQNVHNKIQELFADSPFRLKALLLKSFVEPEKIPLFCDTYVNLPHFDQECIEQFLRMGLNRYEFVQPHMSRVLQKCVKFDYKYLLALFEQLLVTNITHEKNMFKKANDSMECNMEHKQELTIETMDINIFGQLMSMVNYMVTVKGLPPLYVEFVRECVGIEFLDMLQHIEPVLLGKCCDFDKDNITILIKMLLDTRQDLVSIFCDETSAFDDNLMIRKFDKFLNDTGRIKRNPTIESNGNKIFENLSKFARDILLFPMRMRTCTDLNLRRCSIS